MNVPEYSGPAMESLTGRERSLMLKALIPCFIGTILLGLASNGVHHDDDLTHYLMARWARWFPGYLLHVWGRPGATIPMAAVAWIGDADVAWHVCRALSACVTAATAWMAAVLAARMGIGPAWAVVLLFYVQPFALMLAATTLTENYLAFYLIAAALLLDKRRPIAASLVFSLSLLSRHETLVLVPVWWASLIWNSEWRIANSELMAERPNGAKARGLISPFAIRYSLFVALAVSLWAPIVHNVLHYAAFAKWPAAMFLTPKGSTEYVATSVLGYMPAALQAIPPAVFALALLGGLAMIRRRDWLIPGIAGTFLATHCAVTAFGVFASGGYPRFMAGIAPFVAILAALGIRQVHTSSQASAARVFWFTLIGVLLVGWLGLEVERREGRIPLPYPMMLEIRLVLGVLVVICVTQAAQWPNSIARMRLSAVAVIAAVTVLQTAVWMRPLRLKPAHRQIQTAVTWLRENQLADKPIYATNAWFPYFMNFVENPRVHKGSRLLAAMPVGTLVLWDSTYSGSDYHGVKLVDLKSDVRHYRHIRSFEPDPTDLQKMRMVLFEKIAETPIPPDPDRPYPPSTSADQETIHTSYYIVP